LYSAIGSHQTHRGCGELSQIERSEAKDLLQTILMLGGRCLDLSGGYYAVDKQEGFECCMAT
jgi:hypothetical protein